MTTITDVAKRAGVSSTTVSHVLNNTRFVSDETRKQVEQAIEDLNYRPNALARSLRRGDTKTIGLIVPDSGNPFFAEVGHFIEITAFKAGYNVILCNTENNPKKESLYIDVLIKKQVDGVVFVSTGEYSDTITNLLEMQIPMVVLDRDFPSKEVDVVLTDNMHGGYLATKHLISLGHNQIGCISGPSFINPSNERIIGYKKALEEANIPINPELIITGDFSPQSGWNDAHTLLTSKDPPTAIFACNDMMAIGVLRKAAELECSVPNNLAVVGYDDIELASYTNPPLTTIQQPKLKMGQATIECILNRITRKNYLPCRTKLPVSLVVRESCGERSRSRLLQGGEK